MSIEYDQYLKKHKDGVRRAAEWLREYLPGLFEEVKNVEWLTDYNHDASKTKPDEYEPYDQYFYGNRSFEVVQEFNIAWLKHIHRNPHHWQYWILFEDENNGKPIALDMPLEYILEMICDWWSFSWNSGDPHEIFKWYHEHREKMILSDKTRKIVEEILADIKKSLEEILITNTPTTEEGES